MKCTVRVALERLINSSEWNPEVARRLERTSVASEAAPTSPLPAFLAEPWREAIWQASFDVREWPESWNI